MKVKTLSYNFVFAKKDELHYFIIKPDMISVLLKSKKFLCNGTI